MPSLNRTTYLVEDDRGSGRYRMLMEARAEQVGAETAAAVVLHDISRTGLLFEADFDLAPDTEIDLDIPGLGILEARTVWGNGHFFGAEFVTPLTPDRLRAALLESKVVWPDFTPAPVPPIEVLRARRDASPTLPDVGAPVPVPVADDPAEPKWPLPARMRFIVGTTLLLWALILGTIWLALG